MSTVTAHYTDGTPFRATFPTPSTAAAAAALLRVDTRIDPSSVAVT